MPAITKTPVPRSARRVVHFGVLKKLPELRVEGPIRNRDLVVWSTGEVDKSPSPREASGARRGERIEKWDFGLGAPNSQSL